MTGAYFDTGVLAKVYCAEPNTAQAVALLKQYRPPLPLTHWHEIELKTAMRLKVFRNEMKAMELEDCLRNLQADMDGGLLKRPVYDLGDVFRKAEDLSNRFAANLGCRTLDILHVAAAIIIGARNFVSFDIRQVDLARKSGFPFE